MVSDLIPHLENWLQEKNKKPTHTNIKQFLKEKQIKWGIEKDLYIKIREKKAFSSKK
jgi:hypothetical protein